jgi:hypothetical protein
MTLDLLDILLVIHFCFDIAVPWPMWVFGVIASVGANLRLNAITELKKKLIA